MEQVLDTDAGRVCDASIGWLRYGGCDQSGTQGGEGACESGVYGLELPAWQGL
jgi:hypothetical protein